MARKKKNQKNGGEELEERFKEKWHSDLHPETKKSIFAILFFILALVLALSSVGMGGKMGNFLFRVLNFFLGKGYFFAPLVLVLMAFSLLFSGERKILIVGLVGGVLFLLSCLSLIEIVFGPDSAGLVGSLTGGVLLKYFDFWAALIITLGVFLISLLLTLNISLKRRPAEESVEEPEEEETGKVVGLLEGLNNSLRSVFEKNKNEEMKMETGRAEAIQAQTPADVPQPAMADLARTESLLAVRKIVRRMEYKKPPLELLQGDRGTPSSGDIRANANIIKRTLENFNIDVEMGEVSIGPTVTQYTLRPAEGVKLSKITALHNDLSLSLAAHPIRIEAPIPGKPLVGIEVPNRSIALVGLRSLLEHKSFRESESPLFFVLGRDVTGAPVFTDLSRMPHLLISGATGSGKSVAMHTLITSFLYRNPPEILRFILVDPKRVELSVYNDIPHLLTPVITDPKKTVQALRWAVREMDRRYDLLSSYKARDIVSYNAKISKSEEEEFLPYLVVIVDELADLMATFPREVEASIIRLAQTARAVGIHLIVATQRPSVEVITGLIKANITSRIALQVASQIDSRTILDTAGAEKLLGHGDMLFMAGDTNKPRRIQGAFVSEQEVKRVVDFLREESEAPVYEEGIVSSKTGDEDLASNEEGGLGDEGDPLYGEAKILIMQAGKASASYLQRRLRVGYARAARLLDILEAKGIIGPADGSKPRDVLVKAPGALEEADGSEV